MLIPVEVEPAEGFIARAQVALADSKTHVYVDTSLLMWLAAVGPSSRAVFIDWASTLNGRIHVPAWSVHEFYRHHQRKTQVNEIAEKCSAVEKALKDLKSLMRVYADGPLVPDKPEMSFVGDLEAAAANVESAMRIAQGWNYEAAAFEVIKWMNTHALAATRAFDAFASLKQRGGARYGHEVPPGFEDGHKVTNRFGDLIFWEDVIADASTRAAATVVVLTRDRKEDWFSSGLEREPSEDLRRLRGRWNPVPVPHPMLTLEMRTTANAALILLDELYMGGVMWLADKNRFGRLAAVTFGMDLARLEAATRPPPGIAERAAKRDAVDTLGLLEANRIIKAARADEDRAAVLKTIADLQGQAPEVEATIDSFTAESISAMDPADLTVLAKRLYDNAHLGPSAAATLARRLLDGIDKVNSLHASAIVGGMLVAAYFEEGVARATPVGQLLQELLEWRVDKGVDRTIGAVSRELKRVRSPALYRPSASTDWIDVRIDASESVTTTPVAVGQIYVGPQGVLTDPPIQPELALSKMLGGAKKATVSELVSVIGRHHGIPLSILRVVDAEGDEERTILSSTGVDRFEPLRQPKRVEDEPLPENAPMANADAQPVAEVTIDVDPGGGVAPVETVSAAEAPRAARPPTAKHPGGETDEVPDEDDDLVDNDDLTDGEDLE
ncbi:hypothetical protein C1D09_011790 [Mesorhizobium intechi]|uniref:PIN like domain-containing protein n=1 Tax=Mesorhizobium intechi TaxID=537601 RepID=A0A8T9ARG2_9HYPH|nr:PIN-like domain-containing protein [Mesorhizobium intechi]TSE11939.1 hypothetical protein C1D09_011790 [Mesorhizobium intechi]